VFIIKSHNAKRLQLELQKRDYEIQNAIDFVVALKDINSESTGDSVFLKSDSYLLNALQDLKVKLKKLVAEEGISRWIANAETEVLLIQQTKSTLLDFAHAVLAKIVKIVGAQQACLFAHEKNAQDEYLQFAAGYACEQRRIENKRIEIGHGILGQAFSDGGITKISPVPQNYTKITSGLCGGNPQSLIVAVLEVEKKKVGLIELAFITPPLPHRLKFIEIASQNIARTIIKFKESEFNAALLSTSQALTQELKKQEEQLQAKLSELESIHREMEMKNQELEKSQREIETLNSLIESKLETQRSLYEMQIAHLKKKIENASAKTLNLNIN